MSNAAIEIIGLTKVYGGGKKALDDVSLTVPQGSMFALLGPNGAGKSTTINILAGLVRKTSGSAKIWGWDIDDNPRNARASIGIVPQEIYFDAFFTPREIMELTAGLYGVPKAKRRTQELLDAVALGDKGDAYSRTLSGGMKRRLLIAKALVHDPPVIILDEPTAGVDIELRQQLWTMVRKLHARGVTIVLTTHYLEEAEELCDTIAIIDHGKVVTCEPKDKLMSRIGEKQVTITLDQDITALPEELIALNAQLENGRYITVRYESAAVPMGRILDGVRAAGAAITDLSTEESDLEDIFLQLTSKKAA
ncbi:MAG: ABC transporter ATP-binding protein [Pseudomonadota bacterium]